MAFDKPENFYQSYAAYKGYRTPVVKPKHVRWYDREFWTPARCSAETSVLELGSGTGEFMSYLKQKGVRRFQGVEQDKDAAAVVDPGWSPTSLSAISGTISTATAPIHSSGS